MMVLPEWGAIWSEIIRVILKTNELVARVRFEITSMISHQNCLEKGCDLEQKIVHATRE